MKTSAGVWMVVCALTAACGDDVGGAGGSGGGTGGEDTTATTAADGVAGGGDGGSATIAFEVVLLDGTASEDTPLAGVEVCVEERSDLPCATSDDGGHVALAVPAESELQLRCASDTHGPAYMTWTTGSEDIDAGTFRLLRSTLVAAGLRAGGAERWPELGAITVNIYEDRDARDVRVEGATVTIDRPEGGLAYVGEGGLPDPALEATTLAGPAVLFDLADGEVTIAIAHPTRTCAGAFGWPTDRPDALRSRIHAGGLSNVTFVCPP